MSDLKDALDLEVGVFEGSNQLIQASRTASNPWAAAGDQAGKRRQRAAATAKP